MPAFTPTIGRFRTVSPRGSALGLWYRRYKLLLALLLVFAVAGGGGLGWYRYVHAQPTQGGVFVEGMVGEPLRLNPLFHGERTVDDEITPLVFRGLLRYDDHQRLVSDLADHWTRSDDGKTYVVTLGDHTWHDGRPVTATDVAFTIGLTQQPGYHGFWSKSFTDVTVHVDSPKQVTLTLKEPFAPFDQHLTLGLLPEHLLSKITPEALAKDPFNLHPVGTGILQFQQLSLDPQQQHIQSLEFRPQTGHFTTVGFRFYATLDAAVKDFTLGRIQALGSTYTPELAPLDQLAHKQVQQQPLQGLSYALYLNLQGPNLKSLAFRQALAYGTPRQQLIQQALNGAATPLTSVYPAQSPFVSSKAETYSYNLATAQDLIPGPAANLPTLTLLISDKPVHQRLAQQLQTAWKTLGVTTNIVSKTSDEVSTMVSRGQGYDLVLLGEQAEIDPDRYVTWHSTQKPPVGLNITGEDNRRVDKALEDGRNALLDTDRQKAYETFQVYLAKDAPVIWLYQLEYRYYLSPQVRGVTLTSLWHPEDRFQHLDQWYLAK